jgi:hypothetical protein
MMMPVIVIVMEGRKEEEENPAINLFKAINLFNPKYVAPRANLAHEYYPHKPNCSSARNTKGNRTPCRASY